MKTDKKNKKILIVSVSAGAGHVQVAKAIEQRAKQIYPSCEILHIDMMDHVSTPLKTTIVDVYDVIIRSVPSLWGYFYSKIDNKKQVDRLSAIIKTVNNLNAKKFFHLLKGYKPDHVICTHSFPAQVIRNCTEKIISELPISLVLTDYGLHSYWIMPNIQHYFVATKKMAWELRRKLPEKNNTRVFVSGIPVRPIFYEKKDHDTLRKKHGIKIGSKCILLLSGGQGMVELQDVFEKIRNELVWENTLEVIAIAGKNKKLKTKLEKLKNTRSPLLKLHVIGWTEHIDEYMRIADFIVSKPGGSTTSECLVLGKTFIAVQPIPGQEEKNAQFLIESNKGYIAQSEEDLLYYLQYGGKTDRKKQHKNPADMILKTVLEE